MTGGGEQERSSWLVACHLAALPAGLMSCKSRAEAFARRLHTKLKSLSGRVDDEEEKDVDVAVDGDGDGVSSSSTLDKSHLNANNPARNTQSADEEEELYYDFDLNLETPQPLQTNLNNNNSNNNNNINIVVAAPKVTLPSVHGPSTMKGANQQVESIVLPLPVKEIPADEESAADFSEERGTNAVLVQGQIDDGNAGQSLGTMNDVVNYVEKMNDVVNQLEKINGEDEKTGGDGDDDAGEEEEEDAECEEDKSSDINSSSSGTSWRSLKHIDRIFHQEEKKNQAEDPQDEGDDEDEVARDGENEDEDEDANKEDYEVSIPITESESLPPMSPDPQISSMAAFDSLTLDCTRPKHIYRSSSLKTGKTPPGTPGRKKIVRFADVLGLDLEDIRHICLEDLPHIPQSAYDDLDATPEVPPPSARPPNPAKTLVAMFGQPGCATNFTDRVRIQKVCLENAGFIEGAIRGQIRVQNLHFDKQVWVRFSTNEWRSFVDVEANFVPQTHDTFSDRFTFCIYGSENLEIGERVIFCIRYSTLGQEFWDNNYGHNYFFQCVLECLSQQVAIPPSPLIEDWVHFL